MAIQFAARHPERTSALIGDRRWRDLLVAHDAAVRHEIERFGGREIKSIGDGFLARQAAPSAAPTRS